MTGNPLGPKSRKLAPVRIFVANVQLQKRGSLPFAHANRSRVTSRFRIYRKNRVATPRPTSWSAGARFSLRRNWKRAGFWRRRKIISRQKRCCCSKNLTFFL